MAKLFANRLINPIQHSDLAYRLLNPNEYKKMNANVAVMHKFAHKVIEDRRSALEASIADGTYKPC